MHGTLPNEHVLLKQAIVLVKDIYNLSPERLRKQVLPYIFSHTSDVFVVTVLEALRDIDQGAHLDVGQTRHIFQSGERGGCPDLRMCLDKVVNSEHLEHLEYLKISQHYISRNGFGALMVSPYTKNLKELELDMSSLSAAVNAETLLGSRHFDSLRTVYIGDRPLSGFTVNHLLDPDAFPALEELYLCGNELGDKGIDMMLSGFSARTQLTHLRLARNSFGDFGAYMLAAAKVFPKLQVLDLSHNDIGNTGLTALLTSPHFPQLKLLVMRDIDLEDYEPGLDKSSQQALLRHHLGSQLKFRGQLATEAEFYGPELMTLMTHFHGPGWTNV